MYTLWSLVLAAAGLSEALNLGLGLESDKKAPLRFMQRDVPYVNGTSSQMDTTTKSTSTSSSNSTSSSTTYTSLSTSSSTLTVVHASTTSSISTSATTSISSTKIPKLPSSTGIFTNTSTSIDSTITTPSATCIGSVTYQGTIPPTVYVTVTQGFDVTVPASNVSVTETPTLITPLPACSVTIVSVDGSLFGSLGSTNSGGNAPQEVTATSPFNIGGGAPNPNSPALGTGVDGPGEASSAPVYSSVQYTSTVVVTKKTPVTVVVPPTSSPSVNFNNPTPTPTPSTKTSGGSNGDGGGGQNGNGGGGGNTGGGGGGSNDSPAGGGGNTPAPVAPAVASPVAPDAFASINVVGQTGVSIVVNSATPTTVGIGNIIASIINSPFATATPTTHAPALAGAAPLTTAIGGVPIVILPSNSVAIGGSTIAIPNLAPTTVQVSGTVYTVKPSEIIAPSATVSLAQHEQVVTPVPTATITTKVGDLTLTVGPTAAVISGTTYRIGSGAPATTVVIDGTSISIGAGGVGLPSKTIAPGGITGSPFVVYTTQGLTFSVGSTVAVVGGTTYRVGSNAPDVTTTIGPKHVTVSFGPGGVGLASTTLAPGGSPFVIVTADGMTFSVDGTEAVVSGTTYRIGSNAPTVTTAIGSGHSPVSFGPGGVGLKSTTILPTTAPASASGAAQTGSRSMSGVASPTQSLAAVTGASNKVPTADLLLRCLIGISLVCFI